MDVHAAWEGISGDMRELLSTPAMAVVLALTLALPAVSLGLVLARRRIALAPLVLSLGLFSVWFLYYATDWWSNPGLGVWMPAFLVVLCGWGLVAVAARPRRS